MKKRLLAVVLAVCMIASCCVLFASAAELKADTYLLVKKEDYQNNAQISKASTGLTEIKVEATKNASMKSNGKESGTYSLSESACKDLVSISPSVYAKAISYSGSITNESSKKGFADVECRLSDNYMIFRVKSAVSTDERLKDAEDKDLIELYYRGGALIDRVSDIEVKLVNKLYKVTAGIRISGENYNNLVSAEIAQVEMDVTRKNGAFGAEGKTQKMVTNIVNDLMAGDVVVLTTSLKDPSDEKYYKFNCWVDGSGEIVSNSPQITYVVDDDASYYAVYVETVNRWRISFSVDDGEGKILVFPEGTHKTKTREVYSSAGGEGNIDGQISVLEGKDFKFTLEPAEGYQVGKVIVTDDATGISRNITSLVGLLTGETDWKTLIRATLTETLGTKDKGGTIEPESLGKPSYTFSNVDRDYSIAVTFIKKAPLTPDEGKELPTYPAEGLTLMSAEEAVSEAEAAKAAKGEGTTVPGENGAAGGAGAATSGSVVNPATGSASGSIAVFATLSVAAAAAFVSLKKKEN